MSIAAPSFFFDRDSLVREGTRLRAAFAEARPFPHVVFDDFLPREVFARIASGYPPPTHPDYRRKDYAEQAGRLGALSRGGFRDVDPFVRHFLNELCGMAFLDFLEALTSERGLVADSHFHGAGFHVTLPGGHLALHSDFPRDRFRSLVRRTTVIFYAAEAWSPEWGGELELWDRELRACGASIEPRPNRLVVLAHGAENWHGHPAPLACPPDRARKAIASYYYSAARDGDSEPEARGARWAMHRRSP